MGTILQFRQPDQTEQTAEDVQACLKNSQGRSAEIIIFPGVRIERQDKPQAPNTEPETRKRTKKAARRKV